MRRKINRFSALAIAIVFVFPLEFLQAQTLEQPIVKVNEPSISARAKSETMDGKYSTKEQIEIESLKYVLKDIESAIRDLIPIENSSRNDLIDKRDSDDLKAQQDMAFWAKFMFFATIATFFATLSGLIYVKKTINASIQASRPHVRMFTTIKQKSTSGHVSRIDGVTFKNYGSTPAVVQRLNIQYVLSDTPPHPKNCKYERCYSDGAIMAVNEIWPYKGSIPQLDKSLPKLDALLEEHRRTGQRLFVFGTIVYKDAFDEIRETNFCRQLDPRSNFSFNNGDIDSSPELNKAT